MLPALQIESRTTGVDIQQMNRQEKDKLSESFWFHVGITHYLAHYITVVSSSTTQYVHKLLHYGVVCSRKSYTFCGSVVVQVRLTSPILYSGNW